MNTIEEQLAVVDRVTAHLLAQGKKSMAMIAVRVGGAQNACAYRGADDCKCAIGCLIPDAAYKPWIEGLRCNQPQVAAAFEGSIGIPKHGRAWDLLDDLQRVHDACEVEKWAEELAILRTRAAAGRYAL